MGQDGGWLEMTIYEIEGGRRLEGELWAQGAKNAALPLLSAALLSREVSVLEHCPDIDDVNVQIEILEALGCGVTRESERLTIDAAGADGFEVPRALMGRMRSSVMVLGALLGRHGRGVIHSPGGCAIGARPIDFHLKAFSDMGVRIDWQQDELTATLDAARDSEVVLPFPSVGATENVLLLAAAIPCVTVLRGAAKEPEIVDLAHMLCEMGAAVEGAGGDVITVRGARELRGVRHRALSDRIAAATDLCAAAITGGSLTLCDVNTRHMGSALELLRLAGCAVLSTQDTVWLSAPKRLSGLGVVRTMPYPGFPTDLQAPFLALAASAESGSVFIESMFENRFHHVEQLRKMGADIEVQNRVALVRGARLAGARVQTADLRGGAALMLAGLAAQGVTTVCDAGHIARGYERLAQRWNSLGASIRVSTEEDMPT